MPPSLRFATKLRQSITFADDAQSLVPARRNAWYTDDEYARKYEGNEQEQREPVMIGKKLLTSSITMIFAVLGVSAALASEHERDINRERGGFVVPCSLAGVNPAYHPEVFANAATARSMGFVQSPDGVWHVAPGCRR
jgi:hypothetical protein